MSLKSSIVVQALIRRVETAGAFAMVRHHGDDDAGSVLVLVNTLVDGIALYGPARDENFEKVWEILLVPGSEEQQAEELLARRLKYDPDIWVVEIEDQKGRHFLTEPILDRTN